MWHQERQKTHRILLRRLANCCSNYQIWQNFDKYTLLTQGGLEAFLSLIQRCADDQVLEQAVWGLGNIAGDSIALRNYALKLQTVPVLMGLIYEHPTLEKLKRNCIWTLSNLCRGKPSPDLENFYPIIEPFCNLLTTETDKECLVDLAWSLSYLTDPNPEVVAILSARVDCIEKLISIVRDGIPVLITPSLRILGNIASSNKPEPVDVLIAHDVVPAIFQVMDRGSSVSLQKESSWLLSNITAGTKEQVASVIDHTDLMLLLVEKIKSGHVDVRKEVLEIWF
jgi:hypothetical protein